MSRCPGVQGHTIGCPPAVKAVNVVLFGVALLFSSSPRESLLASYHDISQTFVFVLRQIVGSHFSFVLQRPFVRGGGHISSGVFTCLHFTFWKRNYFRSSAISVVVVRRMCSVGCAMPGARQKVTFN